jgi:uncharacterized protein with HEPN domain
MAAHRRHAQPADPRIYIGIYNDTLWSIIRDDIPALLPELRNLKERHQ